MLYSEKTPLCPLKTCQTLSDSPRHAIYCFLLRVSDYPEIRQARHIELSKATLYFHWYLLCSRYKTSCSVQHLKAFYLLGLSKAKAKIRAENSCALNGSLMALLVEGRCTAGLLSALLLISWFQKLQRLHFYVLTWLTVLVFPRFQSSLWSLMGFWFIVRAAGPHTSEINDRSFQPDHWFCWCCL